MAGTNVVAAKKALIDKLKLEPALAAVQVLYAWTGQIEREIIYGGRCRFDQEYATFKGAGRIERDEHATATVHIEVRNLESDAFAADTRAQVLGAVLEDMLALDPLLGNQPSLLAAYVISGELNDPAFDDDGLVSSLSYLIGFRSFLN